MSWAVHARDLKSTNIEDENDHEDENDWRVGLLQPLTAAVKTKTAVPDCRIGVNMRYASALFGDVDINDNYKVAYTLPDAPAESRGGLIMPAENKSYQVVLIGRGNA